MTKIKAKNRLIFIKKGCYDCSPTFIPVGYVYHNISGILNVSMFRKQQGSKRQGFGIVEVVVAITLLGLLSLALTGMFRGILYIQASALFQKTATLAAQREVESLRNSNYNDLTTGSTIDFTGELPAELPNPKSGQVVVSEPVSGLKRVDVTVTYRHAGKDKQVEVSSSIGIIGITQ